MVNSHIVPLLEEFGLSEKEAKIYLALLELKEAMPSTLARRVDIKRPTAYGVLEQLQRKGYASSLKRKGGQYFRAANPKLLFEIQKNRFEKFEEMLPELESLNARYGARPQMVLFEGIEGIIQVMEDTLSAEGEILCWSNVDQAVNTILADYHPRYLKKKISKKILTKCLFLYDESAFKMKLNAGKELREVYLIPKDKFPFENEINVYNDKVSIISHKDQVGVIIQNEAIANTQRSIFKFAFEYAKMLEPQILSEEHKKEFGY